jgi:hypothetical protein
MSTKMQEAFVLAGEQGTVTPIHVFYRERAVIVEIERHPEIARRFAHGRAGSDERRPPGQGRCHPRCRRNRPRRAAHRAVAGE